MTTNKTPHRVLAHRVEAGDTVIINGRSRKVANVNERSGGYLSWDFEGGTEQYMQRYATVTILL